MLRSIIIPIPKCTTATFSVFVYHISIFCCFSKKSYTFWY